MPYLFQLSTFGYVLELMGLTWFFFLVRVFKLTLVKIKLFHWNLMGYYLIIGYPGTDLVPGYRRYPTRYPGTRVLVPALIVTIRKIFLSLDQRHQSDNHTILSLAA